MGQNAVQDSNWNWANNEENIGAAKTAMVTMEARIKATVGREVLQKDAKDIRTTMPKAELCVSLRKFIDEVEKPVGELERAHGCLVNMQRARLNT